MGDRPLTDDGSLNAPSPARPWDRLRRPTGLVDETRWLFFLCTMLSLVLVLPGVFATINPAMAATAILSPAILVGSWLYQYLTKKTLIWMDIAYCVAAAGFALVSPVPAMAYSFGFTALWFRGLYGSTRRLVLYCAGTTAAIGIAVPLWGLIPSHTASTSGIAVFGTAPVTFLVVGVSRYLALSLFAREDSQRRDATLASLGASLLGITDRTEIYRCASESVAAFCATTEGLLVLVGRWDDNTDSIQIREQAGPFSNLPAEWPFGTTLAESAARRPTILEGTPALEAAAGFQGQWLALPLPDEPGGWMLLGSPAKITDDVVVAFNSLINQVALALRNSQAHHELDTQANTDSLTGLLNRAAFTVAVERAFIARPGRLALMFVDLDDFKTINDGLGHAAGDDLLRHVATRLREAIRGGDLCARIGGDEFAVLLHDADDDVHGGGAALIAQRLIDLISTPVRLNDWTARIGASVGVAHATPDISPELLLQRADIPMYAAKAQGKNRFQVFEPGLLQSEEHLRSLTTLGLRAGTDFG